MPLRNRQPIHDFSYRCGEAGGTAGRAHETNN